MMESKRVNLGLIDRRVVDEITDRETESRQNPNVKETHWTDWDQKLAA